MKKITFISDDDSNIEMECHVNTNNELYISITDKGMDGFYNQQSLIFDRVSVLELIEHLKEEVELMNITE